MRSSLVGMVCSAVLGKRLRVLSYAEEFEIPHGPQLTTQKTKN